MTNKIGRLKHICFKIAVNSVWLVLYWFSSMKTKCYEIFLLFVFLFGDVPNAQFSICSGVVNKFVFLYNFMVGNNLTQMTK